MVSASILIWELSDLCRQKKEDQAFARPASLGTASSSASVMKGIFMQEHDTLRQGRAAFIWKWGASYGLILGLIQSILSLFSSGRLTTILDLLIWLVGFFLIGLDAARQTGRVGTGAQVGLVAGLIGGLIAGIFGIIRVAVDGSQVTAAINQAVQNAAQNRGRSLSPDQIQTIATIGIVISLTVTVMVELALGAGIGALGGLVGRRRATPGASTPIDARDA
jgi:hypothetical protein